MKLKSNIIYSIVVAASLLSACSHDNFAAPDSGIKGAITSSTTNASFQTEQPNGVKIRLLEVKYGSSAQPLDFWVKRDGTFENANMFRGKYKVLPIEGAFFPVDTATVDVNGFAEVNFKVIPFLTITATVSASPGQVTTSYKLLRDKVGGKITECKTIVSAYPTVSSAINEFSTTRNVSADTDDSVLATQYTDTISRLVSGKTYYVRVAAKTNSANNKYNYSEVFEIQIP
jgi:hypothetical protein